MTRKKGSPADAISGALRKNGINHQAIPSETKCQAPFDRLIKKARSGGYKVKGSPFGLLITDDLPERWDLPFCSKADGEGDYWGVADYWAVTPSDDDDKDYKRGFEWGREMVAFTDQAEDHPQALIFVLRDMVRKGRFGHLEAGFFDAVATAALLYHLSLRHGWYEINNINSPFGKPICYPCREKPKRLPFVSTKLSWGA